MCVWQKESKPVRKHRQDSLYVSVYVCTHKSRRLCCLCVCVRVCVRTCVCVCASSPPALPFSLWGAAPELELSIFSLHGSSLTNDPVWIQASASLYLQIHLQSFDLIPPSPPNPHTHTSLASLTSHCTLWNLLFNSILFSLIPLVPLHTLTDNVYFEGWHWYLNTETANSF